MELNTKQLKYSISLLAQQWLDDNRLFIDTETTGLGDDAEIVEICIIDSHGFILLNTLVKPTKPIPDEAIAIHGITMKWLPMLLRGQIYAAQWKNLLDVLALLSITPIMISVNSSDLRIEWKTF